MFDPYNNFIYFWTNKYKTNGTNTYDPLFSYIRVSIWRHINGCREQKHCPILGTPRAIEGKETAHITYERTQSYCRKSTFCTETKQPMKLRSFFSPNVSAACNNETSANPTANWSDAIWNLGHFLLIYFGAQFYRYMESLFGLRPKQAI